MYTDIYFNRLNLPEDVRAALKKCRAIAYAETRRAPPATTCST